MWCNHKLDAMLLHQMKKTSTVNFRYPDIHFPSAHLIDFGGRLLSIQVCIGHLLTKDIIMGPIVEWSKSSDLDCGRGPGFKSRRG